MTRGAQTPKPETAADHEPDSWGMCRICATPDGLNGWLFETDGPCPGLIALTTVPAQASGGTAAGVGL